MPGYHKTLLFANVSAFLLLLCFPPTAVVDGAMLEHERVEEYKRRGYQWPFQEYVPNTPGWKRLMDHRFRQVSEIQDRGERFEGYLQTVTSAVTAPNFTKYGFGLARAPDDLMVALRNGIHAGLEAGNYTLEHDVDVIDGQEAIFIDRPDLTKRVLEELQHYSETWVGMELVPHIAYGFRLYRDQSALHMHVDRPQTHIVSFILHIDSSEDSEPWPILIEDLDGNTHEVTLTSGDMLFYESSKVLHGRPKKLNGSWYSSIFVHYYPKNGWQDTDHLMERMYAVPPEWQQEPIPHQKLEIPLRMVGTGMIEPTCPNNWCSSEHTIQWSGPGEHGYWIAPTMEKIPFHPRKNADCVDLHDDCADFVAWETNECERNPTFMQAHCKKSCGACTETVFETQQNADCLDLHADCAHFAAWETNECETNPTFMQVYCKKSCGLCTQFE